MGKKKNKDKKKSSNVIVSIVMLLVIACGAFLGYSIAKNGGGLQGILATVLGQDIDELQDLDTINILVLRSKWRYWNRINRYHYDMLL